MRRKTGALIPIEVSILALAIDLRSRGTAYFHGFMIARQIKEHEQARLLTAHGTLYRALDRLHRAKFLEREWEDPMLAAAEGRPRRRLYRVTPSGEQALANALSVAAAPAPTLQRRPATS